MNKKVFFFSASTDFTTVPVQIWHQSLQLQKTRNITPLFCKTFVIVIQHWLVASGQLRTKSKHSLRALPSDAAYFLKPQLLTHPELKVFITRSNPVWETIRSLMLCKAALSAPRPNRTKYLLNQNKILRNGCDGGDASAKYVGQPIHDDIICKGSAIKTFEHAKTSISNSQQGNCITAGSEIQVPASTLLSKKVVNTSENPVRLKSLKKRQGKKKKKN